MRVSALLPNQICGRGLGTMRFPKRALYVLHNSFLDRLDQD
jgi:hypothetical protein